MQNLRLQDQLWIGVGEMAMKDAPSPMPRVSAWAQPFVEAEEGQYEPPPQKHDERWSQMVQAEIDKYTRRAAKRRKAAWLLFLGTVICLWLANLPFPFGLEFWGLGTLVGTAMLVCAGAAFIDRKSAEMWQNPRDLT